MAMQPLSTFRSYFIVKTNQNLIFFKVGYFSDVYRIEKNSKICHISALKQFKLVYNDDKYANSLQIKSI